MCAFQNAITLARNHLVSFLKNYPLLETIKNKTEKLNIILRTGYIFCFEDK